MKSSLPQELRLKLDALPNRPGVYLMKNAEGRYLYIGKAKSLRSRVRSYFQEGAGQGMRRLEALLRR